MATSTTTFRTITGTCTVTSGELALRNVNDGRSGIRRFFKDSFALILVLYGILGLISLVMGVLLIIRRDNIIIGNFLCLVGMYPILLMMSRTKYSSDVVTIDRRSLLDIEMHAPRPPAGHGFALITFVDGTLVRRQTIAIPGDAERETSNYRQAVSIMHEAGFLSPEI